MPIEQEMVEEVIVEEAMVEEEIIPKLNQPEVATVDKQKIPHDRLLKLS